MQGVKEAFDEEKEMYTKEIEDEKIKAKNQYENYKVEIEKLQKQISTNGPTSLKISKKIILEDSPESSADDLLAIIMNELISKGKQENDAESKVTYYERKKKAEIEYQKKMTKMKKELKLSFKTDMQDIKLNYERQLKQVKTQIKRKDQDIESLKAELVKKDSEIELLKETNKHYENERKIYSEQVEFLSRVFMIYE